MIHTQIMVGQGKLRLGVSVISNSDTKEDLHSAITIKELIFPAKVGSDLKDGDHRVLHNHDIVIHLTNLEAFDSWQTALDTAKEEFIKIQSNKGMK